MIDLSENQSRRLDDLLTRDCVDYKFLDQFFNHDERLASAYIRVLSDHGLISTIIKAEEDKIPEYMCFDDKSVLFLENGGFLSLFNRSEKEKKIRDLDHKNKTLELMQNSWKVVSGIFLGGLVAGAWLSKNWHLIQKWWE